MAAILANSGSKVFRRRPISIHELAFIPIRREKPGPWAWDIPRYPVACMGEWSILARMPTFDIVSRVDLMEVQNAVHQAQKELANRFDFKGSNAEIQLDNDQVKLSADDNFKLTSLKEMVVGKLGKRGVSMKNLDYQEPEISPLGHAKMTIKIKQGIEGPLAKEICAFIRAQKLKVTASIQGDEVRVSGKKTRRFAGGHPGGQAEGFSGGTQLRQFPGLIRAFVPLEYRLYKNFPCD